MYIVTSRLLDYKSENRHKYYMRYNVTPDKETHICNTRRPFLDVTTLLNLKFNIWNIFIKISTSKVIIDTKFLNLSNLL